MAARQQALAQVDQRTHLRRAGGGRNGLLALPGDAADVQNQRTEGRAVRGVVGALEQGQRIRPRRTGAERLVDDVEQPLRFRRVQHRDGELHQARSVLISHRQPLSLQPAVNCRQVHRHNRGAAAGAGNPAPRRPRRQSFPRSRVAAGLRSPNRSGHCPP